MENTLPSLIENTCWKCRQKTKPDLFCDHCSKIQPAGPNVDFFTVLGLSRRMTIDKKDLEQRYYDRSRKTHPDYFQDADPYEQQLSLEQSAILNQAYQALRESFSRAECLVKLVQGSDQDIAATPPQELLEEVFDFNERLQDLKIEQDEEEKKRLVGSLGKDKAQFMEKETVLRKDLDVLFTRWDAAFETGEDTSETIESLRSLLAQRKYVQNAISDIEEAINCPTSV